MQRRYFGVNNLDWVEYSIWQDDDILAKYENSTLICRGYPNQCELAMNKKKHLLT